MESISHLAAGTNVRAFRDAITTAARGRLVVVGTLSYAGNYQKQQFDGLI